LPRDNTVFNNITDLSRNEFLFDHPLLVNNSLPQLSAQHICRYQMTSNLVAKLAEHHNIDSDHINLCNGAEHAMKTIFSAVAGMGKATLLLPTPGWDYYWRLAAEYNIATSSYCYTQTNNNNFALEINDLEARIQDTVKPILLIASPLNPLGSHTDRALMQRLAQLVATKGYTIVDKTYDGYSHDKHRELSLSEILTTMPQTLAICSFSKYYGMPGLRVGFTVAPKAVQKTFAILREYLGFNVFSDYFAVECLSRHNEFAHIAHQVIENRKRLSNFFALRSGFEPFQSSANFILVRTPEGYAVYMLKNGIKIKSFSESQLQRFVRITIPPLHIVERIEALTTQFLQRGSISIIGSTDPRDMNSNS
jgi:histidinol-phosphate/aromatic aminotransferase/cobyric acid decarboxylase-like protein